MMNHQRGLNRYGTTEIARTTARRLSTSSGQSGVYDKVASQSPALPSFWREEDYAQDVAVASTQPSGPTLLGTLGQVQQAKRELWQVALFLRGEELTRLWRRNSSHLVGRVFVWSEHAKDWVQLHASQEPIPMYQQPLLHTGSAWQNPAVLGERSLPGYAAPYAQPHASLRAVEPVDLSDQARTLSERFNRQWAVGVLAAALALVALGVGLSRKTQHHGVPVQEAAQQQPREPLPSGATKTDDIVSVSALPLVRAYANAEAQKQGTPLVRAYASREAQKQGTVAPAKIWLASAPTPYTVSAPAVTAAGAFDPTVARLALSRAAWQAGHCASTDISGSVLVTYDPSGAVQDVSLSSLVGDQSRAPCIVSSFRTARISPFRGSRVTVKKSFSRRGGV
jgi:hypothetical protein